MQPVMSAPVAVCVMVFAAAASGSRLLCRRRRTFSSNHDTVCLRCLLWQYWLARTGNRAHTRREISHAREQLQLLSACTCTADTLHAYAPSYALR